MKEPKLGGLKSAEARLKGNVERGDNGRRYVTKNLMNSIRKTLNIVPCGFSSIISLLEARRSCANSNISAAKTGRAHIKLL